MLVQLKIQNFALVEQLAIEFDPKLNVLTGETGAGKSILIDAIRFVLGERMDQAKRATQDHKSVVEAVFEVKGNRVQKDSLFTHFFEDDEEMLILRREILPTGKTRAWVNSQAVPASVLKQMGAYLLDIHGQYDHQLILDSKTHLDVLDQYASLQALKDKYTEQFSKYQILIAKRDELRALEEGREREMDLLKYQIDEIGAAELEEGEEEKLQTERVRLANAEKLYELATSALQSLDGDDFSVSSKLGNAHRDLSGLARLDESLEALKGSFEDAQLAIEEVIRSVRDYQENLSFDPDRLQEIDKRLDQMEHLKRKYGGSLAEVLRFFETAKEKYDKLLNSGLYEKETGQKIATLKPELKKIAMDLRKKRKKAANEIKELVESELTELHLKHAVFETSFEEQDFGLRGCDGVKFLMSLNPGYPPMDLVKIISGGEASRVMLALKKALMKVDPVPSLIFDEIDANIGGRLGSVVGKKLKEIAKAHQVFLITHLPQIASFANKHFKVTKKTHKSKTVTDYHTLEGEERVKELAQMMSGKNETDISKKHAKEMLDRVKA